MRKVVSGYVSKDSDLEPMLVEMCGRIHSFIGGRKKKGLVPIRVRLILEGEHHQAEVEQLQPTSGNRLEDSSQICRCESGDGWREQSVLFPLNTFKYCPSCGKLLLPE